MRTLLLKIFAPRCYKIKEENKRLERNIRLLILNPKSIEAMYVINEFRIKDRFNRLEKK